MDFLKKTKTLFSDFIYEMDKLGNVDATISQYNTLLDENTTPTSQRKSKYMAVVNYYYNVSTMLYEWGWSACFHFANRWRDESFLNSLQRHEIYLAYRLQVSPGDKIMDVGCGIGGPMRNIAKFSGASVVGINNNDYQIKRATKENISWGLDKQCSFVKADFNEIPINENEFDGAYAIEATCHAPVRERVFGEIFRTLKPGKLFVGYEWCLTDKYDPKNPSHVQWKKWIEIGDALPTLTSTQSVDDSLKSVGFELVQTRDVALDNDPKGWPWYEAMSSKWYKPWRWLVFSSFGFWICIQFLLLLEALRIIPNGTHKVSLMLENAIKGLVPAGEAGVFTPMYFFVARKPMNSSSVSFSASLSSKSKQSEEKTNKNK